LKGFGEKTADRIFEVLTSYYEDEPLKDKGAVSESAQAPEANPPATAESGDPGTDAAGDPQPDEESKPVGDAS
jgi:hypothetical protein